MIKLKQAFENKKALMAFITAGDPDLETTEKLIYEMEKNGIDLIEIGIPFSDPIAEGPVIQESDIRALENGTTTEKVFEFIEKIRPNVHIPLVFVTYLNVIFAYDSDKFIERCSKSGIDGIIVPDMPYEERDEILPYCKKYGVELVTVISLTSHNRIAKLAENAEGFLYISACREISDIDSEITDNLKKTLSLANSVSDIPCAAGFGVSTPEQVAKVCEIADGAAISSAVVDIVGKYGRESIPYVAEYIKSMSEACRIK